MTAIGSRVGAMQSRDDKSCNFYGYGVYLGDFIHPAINRLNPKIQLDNGKQVWGCECWWGPEAQVMESIVGLAITDVSHLLQSFDGNSTPPVPHANDQLKTELFRKAIADVLREMIGS